MVGYSYLFLFFGIIRVCLFFNGAHEVAALSYTDFIFWDYTDFLKVISPIRLGYTLMLFSNPSLRRGAPACVAAGGVSTPAILGISPITFDFID